MTEFKISRATVDDAEAMRRCVRSAYRHYVDRIGKEPGPMLDDYASRVENDEAYVVRSGGTVIGVLVLIVEAERLLLDNVAVDPGFSGRGLGKALVRFAEERALQLGFDEIELYTHELMTENIEMYQRWGYRITRRVSEKGYDRIYMAKKCREPT